MKEKQSPTRRKFIGTGAIIAAGMVLPSHQIISAPAIIKYYKKPNSIINGVQIGVITYSFRSMPDQDAESTLKYILDTGIDAIELMGGPAESFAGIPESSVDRRALFGLMRKQRNGQTLNSDETGELDELRAQMKAHNELVAAWRINAPMNKFEKFRKLYNDAGVKIYGFKPSAFGKNNTDAEIDYGLRAAKALGASHVTLEHPSDDAHTLKLGKMAGKHKIKVAYHGHEQQTPTLWDTALEQSEYNMINPDFGHYVAAGNPKPLELLQRHHQRISSIHLKDRQNPANGKENLEWGKGDTPIGEILKVMSKEGYKFPGTVELEYKIPDGSDAVKEVGRCLEFCRKALMA